MPGCNNNNNNNNNNKMQKEIALEHLCFLNAIEISFDDAPIFNYVSVLLNSCTCGVKSISNFFYLLLEFVCLFVCVYRVWNCDKRTKEGNPSLARNFRAILPGGRQSAVMAITAHENMNLIAVGFKDGTVVLIRGNIARDRQSRMKTVHEESQSGVYISGQGRAGVVGVVCGVIV